MHDLLNDTCSLSACVGMPWGQQSTWHEWGAMLASDCAEVKPSCHKAASEIRIRALHSYSVTLGDGRADKGGLQAPVEPGVARSGDDLQKLSVTLAACTPVRYVLAEPVQWRTSACQQVRNAFDS